MTLSETELNLTRSNSLRTSADQEIAHAGVSRRAFLQGAAVSTGALVIGIHLPAGTAKAADKGAPNAWLEITPDNHFTFILDRAEMGQGVYTSLTTLLAEELDVNPTRFTVRFAPIGDQYNNPDFNAQITGGSTSVKTSWDPLRKAGASARDVILRAAASAWGVAVESLTTDNGEVIHTGSNRRATYGSFVQAASTISVRSVPLKEAKAWKYINHSVGRMDALAKVTGKAEYGVDVKRDGLLVAVVIHPPALGATLASFDGAEAEKASKVKKVFAIPQGIAVVAEGYWEARQAAALVKVQWNPSPLTDLNQADLEKKFTQLAADSGKNSKKRGNAERVFEKGAEEKNLKIVEALYEVPYAAHATMEPQNYTATFTGDRLELEGPTQSPGLVHHVGVIMSGLPRDKVTVRSTFLGGGFGRRLEADVPAEVIAIALKMPGIPVKLMWSREDDVQHDLYRPASHHVFKAAVAADGSIEAFTHKVVSQSILSTIVPNWMPATLPRWIPMGVKQWAGGFVSRVMKYLIADPTATEGVSDTPYKIENFRADFVVADLPVPIGFWRSVGHSGNGFVVEGFIDELAHAAGKDPLAFRRPLLAEAPRNLAVMELAATKAGWGSPLPANVFRGLAVHASFGSYVAQVVEASVVEGTIRVHRVVCAADCGTVVNPDIVKASIESGIVFGLTQTLGGAITFKDGAVEQSNFHDNPVLRMNEAPKIEVHLIASSEPPAGVGEIGVPPIAGAVGNAVFAATGKRLRRLPFKLS